MGKALKRWATGAMATVLFAAAAGTAFGATAGVPGAEAGTPDDASRATGPLARQVEAVLDGPAPEGPVVTADCRAEVAEFSERNAILFRSGSAELAPESAAALDELAVDLGLCPEAVVHVEGHTDSDGSAALNLALSVARAEAVVAALAERGVRQERLYAIGYGQSQPVADNATAEGRQLNRRIVITLFEDHEEGL